MLRNMSPRDDAGMTFTLTSLDMAPISSEALLFNLS